MKPSIDKELTLLKNGKFKDSWSTKRCNDLFDYNLEEEIQIEEEEEDSEKPENPDFIIDDEDINKESS